eukprot:3687739-Prymnesium_polylepis.1
MTEVTGRISFEGCLLGGGGVAAMVAVCASPGDRYTGRSPGELASASKSSSVLVEPCEFIH